VQPESRQRDNEHISQRCARPHECRRWMHELQPKSRASRPVVSVSDTPGPPFIPKGTSHQSGRWLAGEPASAATSVSVSDTPVHS